MPERNYLGFGDATEATERSALGKALTTGYVSGPSMPSHGMKSLHVELEVSDWGALTEIYVKCQESFDGAVWSDKVAGTSLSAVGTELQSDNVSYVQVLKKVNGNNFRLNWAALGGSDARLLLKGDAAGGVVRAKCVLKG